MGNKSLMVTLLISATIVAVALGLQPIFQGRDNSRIINTLNQINQTHREVDIIFGIIGLNESDIDTMEKILNITNNDSEMNDALHNNVTFKFH